MAAGNRVTIRLTGDSREAEESFRNIAEEANRMAERVGESRSGFDRVSDGFDAVDNGAMGFRDTITGVQDSMAGFSALAEGNYVEGLYTLGMGVGDLASGFVNFIIPVTKATAGLVAQRAATVGSAVASGVARAATVTWTAVQWALNAALTANPIGLVIVAIGLLIGIIVLIATKTRWFQQAWNWVWERIGPPVMSIFNWIKDNWKRLLPILTGPIGIAVSFIVSHWDAIVRGVRSIPGRIRSAASGMWNGIKDSFRGALNWIIDRWNGLSFRLPSVTVFGRTIGGTTLSTPNIRRFQAGGVVPGGMNDEVPVILHGGERILNRSGSGSSDRPTTMIVIQSSSRVTDVVLDDLVREVRRRGGLDVVFERA